MTTTVRIVCEVELTVDAWDSKSTFESLAVSAAREGEQKLRHMSEETGRDLRLVAVKEIKFVTHSIPWNKDSK